MFKLLFSLFVLVGSFDVHTKLDTYAKICDMSNIEELYEDINDHENNIRAYMDTTYGKWIFYNKLTEIIIVNNNVFDGYLCSPSTIVLNKTNDLDYKNALNGVLMSLIHYNIIEYDREWDDTTKFSYVNDNNKTKLRQGFLTNIGMKNRNEDMISFFKEVIHPSYVNDYDLIMISKFKLLYKILVSFDREFENIIKNKMQKNKKLPNNEFIYISEYQKHMNQKAVVEIFFTLCGFAFMILILRIHQSISEAYESKNCR